MDSDLTPLNWLQNIDIMSQCGIDENPDRKANGGATIVTIVDTTDYSTTNKKPPLSYSSLITKAIKSNPNNKMTLSQIYNWIRENYMYYSRAEPSWQNSIRHNLSLNKCFVKIPRGKDERGKGGFWSLDETLVGRCGSKRKKKKKGKIGNGTGSQNSSNNENMMIVDNVSDTTSTSTTTTITLNNNDMKITNNNIIIHNNNNGTPNHCMDDAASCFSLGNNHESPFTDLASATKLSSNLVLNGHIDINDDSQGNQMSALPDHPSSNNNTIIVNHPEDSCIDICQDVFISSHEEIVESEIIESELILENVYWESVLDLDHLISMGEL